MIMGAASAMLRIGGHGTFLPPTPLPSWSLACSAAPVVLGLQLYPERPVETQERLVRY